MDIRPFCSKEVGVLNEWLKAREHQLVTYKELPEIGFIAYKWDKPIAVAFLRCVEGGVGVYDSMASNPDSSCELRHEALYMLYDQIEILAKKMGLHHIYAYTIDPSVIKRSQIHGFVTLPHALLMKKLEKE